MSKLTLKQAENLVKQHDNVMLTKVVSKVNKTIVGHVPDYYYWIYVSETPYSISKKTALYLSETYNIPIR